MTGRQSEDPEPGPKADKNKYGVPGIDCGIERSARTERSLDPFSKWFYFPLSPDRGTEGILVSGCRLPWMPWAHRV